MSSYGLAAWPASGAVQLARPFMLQTLRCPQRCAGGQEQRAQASSDVLSLRTERLLDGPELREHGLHV